jgi:molecular chaperone GrpE
VSGDARIPEPPVQAGAADDDVTDEQAVAPDGAAAAQEEADAVSLEEHAQVVEERDAYLDALQRLKAEFDNYRKRVERDREVQHHAGVRDLVAELLPVIDNLERAVAALGDAGDQIVAGVEMVRGQLAGLLAGRGVEEIAAHAEPFDPTVHEAIAQHPTDEHEEGTVVHVSEKGYRLGELVIRPAKVVVAARPPEES